MGFIDKEKFGELKIKDTPKNKNTYNLQETTGPINSKFGNLDFGKSQYDSQSQPSEDILSGSYNELRGERQPWYDKAANGVVNMSGRALTSGAEGILNPFIGTFYAIKDGKLSSYIDNPFNRLMDSADKQIKEAVPFYSTKEEKESHGLNKLLYANTYFRDALDGVGFTLGALATGGVYSKLINAIGKTAMVGKAGEFIDGLNKIENASDKLKYIENANTLNKVKDGVKNGIINGFTASAEAEQQARGDANQFETEWNKNHPNATPGEIAYMKSLKDDLMLHSFAFNMPIISLDNYIVFGKSVFGNKVTDKVNLKSIGEGLIKDGETGYKSAEKYAIDAIVDKTYGLRKALEPAISEGIFQEQSQYGISQGVNDYYAKKYNNPEAASFVESFGKGIYDAYGTKEGWDQGIIGALSGGLMGNLATLKQEGLKAYKDPNNITSVPDELKNLSSLKAYKDLSATLIRHANLVETQKQALKNNDNFNYENAKNDDFINYVSTKVKYGKTKDLLDELDNYKNMSEVEFKSNFGNDLSTNEITQQKQTVSQFVEDKINKVKQIQRAYDIIDERFPNVSEGNKERLAYSSLSIDNAKSRKNKLNEEARQLLTKNINFTGATGENNPLVLLGTNYIHQEKEGKKLYKKHLLEANMNPMDLNEVLDKLVDIDKLEKREELFVKEYKDLMTKEVQESNDKKDSKVEKQIIEEKTNPTETSSEPTLNENDQTDVNPEDTQTKEQPKVDYTSLVKKATSSKELDSITDQATKDNLYTPELLDLISRKRDLITKIAKAEDESNTEDYKKYKKELQDLNSTTTTEIVTETLNLDDIFEEKENEESSETSESQEDINKPGYEKEFELGKIPNNIFKTNTGWNKGDKNSQNTFQEYIESTAFDGQKLLIVTKKTNSKLYAKLLEQNTEAVSTDKEDSIWVVVVDKNNKPIISKVDGKEYNISATLETGKRLLNKNGNLDSSEGVSVDVARGENDKTKAKQIREQALADIKKLREDITNLKEGNHYLNITGKSKGLIDDNGANTAFENKDPKGNRVFHSVIGRIANTIKEIELEIPTLSNKVFGSVPALLGKLYAKDNNSGRVFDLIPKNLNKEEIDLISALIHKRLETGDRDLDDEIKKLIAFRYNPKDKNPQFQIFFDKNNNLVFGKNELKLENFNEKLSELQSFLETKKVSANTKLLAKNKITYPSLDKNGKEITPKEFLLGGDNPMFGTDLKPILNEEGKPNKRFIQMYYTYENSIKSDDKIALNEQSIESKKADIEKRRQEALNEFLETTDKIYNKGHLITEAENEDEAQVLSNIWEVYDEELEKLEKETKPTKKNFTKRDTGGLNRLELIARRKNRNLITQEEKNWFKELFPNIPIERILGLIENKSLGQVTSSGRLLLSNLATTGTLRHEAFHIITQLYLTREEIDKLYNETSKDYPGKTRKELEEILAEDFVDYKDTGKILNQPVKSNIFKKLLDFIKNILGLKASTIQQVYDRLDKGYYTNKQVIGNREFSTLNRDEATKKITEEKGTKFVKDVLDSFDARFFKILKNNQEKLPLALVKDNNITEATNKIFNDIQDKYLELEDNKLTEDFDYILENFDDLLKIWNKRLSINGYEFKIDNNEEEDIIAEDNENKSDLIEDNTNSKADFGEKSQVNPLSTIENSTRLMLRSLVKVDKSFNPILNDLGEEVPVDFGQTYNYLLKNTVGTGSNYTDLYNQIDSLVKDKSEFKELLNWIQKPQWQNLSDAQFNLQTKFLSDFNKNRADSVITQYDEEGNIRTINANRQNEQDKVKTIWENQLVNAGKLNEQTGKITVNTDITKETDNIKFLASIGITFDPNTLNYINSKQFTDSKQLNDSVKAIKDYIIHHNGDITNLYDKVKDSDYSEHLDSQNKKKEDKKFQVSGGRLNFLLNLEAQHTSIVNELSFISADGKTEYSVGEPNGLAITTNIINNSKSIEDLQNKLPNLFTIGTKGSLYLNELFDENGIRDPKVKIILELHSGSQTTKEEGEDVTKLPFRKSTPGDMYALQIANILEGRSSYIVSADKTQEWTLKLNNYNGNEKLPIEISKFKDGFDIPKLKSIFLDYFKSEFEGIARWTLDDLGKNYDVYRNQGGKWTIFQDILTVATKDAIKNELQKYKAQKDAGLNITYDNSKKELNTFIEGITKAIEDDIVNEFFPRYEIEFTNKISEYEIKGKQGLPKDLLDQGYTPEQLIRATIVTDFINSIEQTKLYVGNLAFYKDLYKRTAKNAGQLKVGRVDEETNEFLKKNHPRKDGKSQDGHENTIVYNSVETEKDVSELIKSYLKEGYSEEEARKLLGWKPKLDKQGNRIEGKWEGEGAYGKADEADAQGLGSLDFYKEISQRLGQWNAKQNNAYNIHQEQVWKGKELKSGRLLTKDEVALFPALKLQYNGPINSNDKSNLLYIPGYYKFTVLPLIPQMVTGTNMQVVLDNMIKNKAGMSLFKSASKVGTEVNSEGKANKFYTNGNHGEINTEDLFTQSISYKYLGLQVKPSEPHNLNTFSTQFRATIWINAFTNGKPNYDKAQEYKDSFDKLLNERTERDKARLIKELNINPTSHKIEDVTKLVNLLIDAGESRKLTDNIINSLDVEEVNGIKQLKYSISSMVNKPKIDSILMSLLDSRLIKQKFNGDAYVLGSPTGFEPLGNRKMGSNAYLRGYTKDENGNTLPAQVQIAMSKNYYALFAKYDNDLNKLNEAIAKGEVNGRILRLVGCRIPGQGMNSNEYLTIHSFLPESSATTMIAHPDIVAKAGSDYDNDKLYVYRSTLDKDGNYKDDDLDNKIIDVISKVISDQYNFVALNTPNSTSIFNDIADGINYTEYLNNRIEKNKKRVLQGRKEKAISSKEDYLSERALAGSNQIRYTELLKLHKKIEARYKLLLAKDSLGIAALGNKQFPIAQMTNITGNKEYIQDGTKYEVKINAPHNEIKDGKLDFSAEKDAFDKNYISEVLNQFINITVDAAKEEKPIVSVINITTQTMGIGQYLIKDGVPASWVTSFLVQPIVKEYLNTQNVNKSIFLKALKKAKSNIDIFNDLKSKYSKGLTKEQIEDRKDNPEILSQEDLDKYQLVENQIGEDYQLFQLQVLNDFTNYKREAQLFSDYNRITNVDSAGMGKNIDSERLKLQHKEKTLATGFINGIEDILNNTFIKSFNQGQFAIDTYKDLYDTQDKQLAENRLKLYNEIINSSKKFLTGEQKDKLITNIENDFIAFVIQNYAYVDEISKVKEALFKTKGENKSVAQQLLDLKTKKNPTDTEKKILDNILIQELFPLIDKAKPGSKWDNVKMYSKRIDTFQSDQLTEAFRQLEILDIDLASRLIHLGILQSGLNNSPITYLGIIPFEHYNELVKDSFKIWNKKNEAEKQIEIEKFNDLFKRNRSGKLGYGMFGKEFDITKAKEETKAEETITQSPVYLKNGIHYQFELINGLPIKGKSQEGLFGFKDMKSEDIIGKYNELTSISTVQDKNLDTIIPIPEETDKKPGEYELFPGVFANAGQKEALNKLNTFLKSKDEVFTLVGRGGTGKSTIIKKILETAPQGKIIGGITPTHKAKKVLGQSIGKDKVKTVHSALAIKMDDTTGRFEPDLFARSQGKIPINKMDIIIVDEASMITKALYKEIMDLKKPSAKVIFMGDNAQLPPIGETGDSIVFDAKDKYTLLEKMRQAKTSPIIKIGTDVAENIESKEPKLVAIPKEDRNNKFDETSKSQTIFTSNVDSALDSLTNDFKQANNNPDFVKAITFNNERHNSDQSVKNLNSKIREKIWGDKSKNQFNEGELITAYDSYINQDISDEPIVYNSDDFIIKKIEERKNESGYITAFSKAKGSRSFKYEYDITHLTVIDNEGNELNSTVPVISESSKAKFEKDLEGLWNTDKQLGIKLRQAFANIQYGYAITSHKAQGSTYTNVYVFEDNILGPTNGGDTVTKNKSLYVAVSRPTTKLVVISNRNSENEISNTPLNDKSDNIIESLDLEEKPKTMFDDEGNFIASKATKTVNKIDRENIDFTKKEIGIRNPGFSYSDLAKNLILKRLKQFNTIHGTKHSVNVSKIGESQSYNLDFKFNNQFGLDFSQTTSDELFNKKNEARALAVLNNMSKRGGKLSKYLMKFTKFNNAKIILDDVVDYPMKDGRIVSKEEATDRANGYYDRSSNTIHIAANNSFEGTTIDKVILHEIIHSISAYILKNQNNETAKDFIKAFEYTKNLLKGDKNYALTNIDEFIVGLFQNKDLINKLKELPASKEIKKYKNLFQEFFDYIMNLLGIGKNDSLYEQAYSIATNVFEEQAKQSEEDKLKQDYENNLGDEESPLLASKSNNPAFEKQLNYLKYRVNTLRKEFNKLSEKDLGYEAKKDKLASLEEQLDSLRKSPTEKGVEDIGRQFIIDANNDLAKIESGNTSGSTSRWLNYIKSLVDAFGGMIELSTEAKRLEKRYNTIANQNIEETVNKYANEKEHISLEQIDAQNQDNLAWNAGTGSLIDSPNYIAKTIGLEIRHSQNKIDVQNNEDRKRIQTEDDLLQEYVKKNGANIDDIWNLFGEDRNNTWQLVSQYDESLETNPNWQKIQDTPELKRYFDWYKNENIKRGQQENFIANIGEKSLKGWLKGLNPFKTRKLGEGYEENQDLKLVPIEYQGKIDAKDKNKNLSYAMLVFSIADNNYQEMSDILPNLKIMQEHLKYNPEHPEEQRQFKSSINPNKFIDADKTNLWNQIDKWIEMQVLGKMKSDQFQWQTKISVDKDGNKTQTYINGAKGLDNFLQYNSLVRIGASPVGVTANLSYGFITNLFEAIGGRYYTLKGMFQANNIFLSQFRDEKSDLNKAHLELNYLQELNDYQYMEQVRLTGKTKRMSLEKTVELMYSLQKGSENWIQSVSATAIMIKDGYFDPKTQKLTEKYLKASDEEKNHLTDKIQRVNHMGHGRYSTKEQAIWSQNVLYRAVSQFRKFVAPGIENRFARYNHSDARLGTDFEGRYRTLKSKVFNLSLKDPVQAIENLLLPIISMQKAIERGNLTENEVYNMRKNMVEIIGALVGILSIMALKGGSDDDRKRRMKLTSVKTTLAILNRISGDIDFFWNPTNVTNITTNIASVNKIFIDLTKAVNYTVRLYPLYLNDWEIKTGSRKSSNKFYQTVGQNIPLLNRFLEAQRLTNKRQLEEQR